MNPDIKALKEVTENLTVVFMSNQLEISWFFYILHQKA